MAAESKHHGYFIRFALMSYIRQVEGLFVLSLNHHMGGFNDLNQAKWSSGGRHSKSLFIFACRCLEVACVCEWEQSGVNLKTLSLFPDWKILDSLSIWLHNHMQRTWTLGRVSIR